jgi:orotate phosphoribosyltransferase
VQEAVSRALSARSGHFRFESGHHGDLWLDLELLCARPEPVRRFAVALARRLAPLRAEVVCGPLVEGAFVALLVAEELRLEFAYTEPFARSTGDGLFPVGYRLPGALRARVAGRRVAVANDVINAGSAVLGTLADLRACGAIPVAIGALCVLGDAAARFAAEQGLPLSTLAALGNELWTPADCPLCARGVPLDEPLAR